MSMELQFPKDGLNEGQAYEKQPATTSPYLNNVRPYDVEKDRNRGGQRPAITKEYSSELGDGNSILSIVQIATTYITPEEGGGL